MLVACADLGKTEELARAMSRELDTACIAFEGQSGADAYGVWVFRGGECVRKLVYSRDYGGWLEQSGDAQPWERAFFFGERDMIGDELSDADLARYDRAKETGDAAAVMDILAPSSLGAFGRIFESLGVDPEKPHGRFHKPSLLGRLFGDSL